MPLLLALLASAAIQDTPEQSRQQVATTDQGALYVITGQGGNILFSTGRDGTFVIDDQFARVAEENLALIEEVSEGPIVFVLNTHYHGDHTSGNAAFVDAGATVISREAVRRRLAAEAPDDGDPERAGEAYLPVITFEQAASFYWNGQPIRAVALRDAHTDGDAMAYFEGSDVLHTGDVFFSGRYPYIDVEAGGSAAGMIAALERILEVAGPDTVVVPGHGPVGTEAQAEDALAMLRDARDIVAARMAAGDDADAIVAADVLSEYDEAYSWGFIDSEKMIRQLHASLQARAARRGRPASPAAEDERAQTTGEAGDEDTMAERLNRAQLDSEAEQARRPAAEVAPSETRQPADPVEPSVPGSIPDTVSPTPNRGG